MKKTWISNGIILFFIALFAYTTISKLLNYQSFQSDISLSPVLGSFAKIAWFIPAIETGIVVLLIIRKWQLIGLWISAAFMFVSAIYLFAILKSEMVYLPCGCGGILEKLPLGTHIYINILFALLASIGIWLKSNHEQYYIADKPL